MPKACERLRAIWTTPLTTRFTFGQPCIGQAVGPDDPCRCLSTEIFYSTLFLKVQLCSPQGLLITEATPLHQKISDEYISKASGVPRERSRVCGKYSS